MSEFTNVAVIKEANVYFDGKVTSRTVKFPDGSHKTLGIMLPGEYSFSTAKREIMDVLAGSMRIRLAGETNWNNYGVGDSFVVPAQSSFDIEVTEVTDYCCSYID